MEWIPLELLTGVVMATVMPWGETVTVLMELGFPVNYFTLDDPILGVLNGEGYLDGTLLGDDVSSFCQSVSITRGRTDPFSAMPAGQATIDMFDTERRFDPTNEDSPYWDLLSGRSGVQPRRKVTIKSGSETVFVGKILDIDLSYSTGKSSDLSITRISAVDDFSILAQANVESAQTPSAELSSARMNWLLSLPEIDYQGAKSIQTGDIQLGSYQVNAGTNALAYAQEIAQAEQGFFFIDRQGTLTFTSRVGSIFPSGVAADFSDDQGSDIKYQSLGVTYGQENFYNKVIATRESGTPQIANQATSQSEYGIKALDLSGLLVETDGDALTIAENIRDVYGQPTYRFDSMGVLVSAQTSGVRSTLADLDLSDIIKIERNFQTGSPAQVIKYQRVERISRQITPSFHRIDLTLSDADLVFQLILNDPIYGRMDEDNALA
jgi:hypothetical protein